MTDVLAVAEHYADMVFTKASVGSDGVKRWAATVSKFAEDDQGDEVTPEFYEHSITMIGKSEHPTPHLVVSHLDDPSQDAMYDETPEIFRAGVPTSLYIDGSKPKAKGVFLDNPLGNALYEAVKADLDGNVPHEERIRISMAWRPELGGVEKSDDGRTIHHKGVIKHFAATRVPIVPETEIMAEKSDTVKRTKLDDARTIIPEDLANGLWDEYQLRTRSKSEDDLVEKSGEEKKGESYKRHVKDGKFDMGDCLTMKLKEGNKRKQALAICLDMKRKSGERVAKKKADLVEKQDTTITEEIRPCVQRMLDNGVELPLAVSICKQEAKKVARRGLTRRLTSNRFLQDVLAMSKADLSVPLDECVRVYMKDHDQSREEAMSTCTSDKAVAARKEAGNEKANYTLEDVLSLVLDDEDVQVVKSDEESETVPDDVMVEDGREGDESMTIAEDVDILSDALLDVLDELEDRKEAPAVEPEPAAEPVPGESEQVVAEEPQAAVNTKEGESPETETVEVVSEDVNEPVAVKAGVKGSNEVDDLVELFKSALADGNDMDQTQKALIFNHALEELGNAARESIAETQASPQDTAELLKAALEEVVGPELLQNQLLVERVNELEAEVQKMKGQTIVPQSKQLRHEKGVPVSQLAEKSKQDTGGALTAAEAAEISVRYSQVY